MATPTSTTTIAQNSTNEPDTRMKVLAADLKDPQAFRLNTIIDDLYSRISSVKVSTTSTTTNNTISGGGGGASGGGGGGTTTIRVEYPPTSVFASSIDRDINEKAGESISVLDFGAVGDGASDCAPAFNAAVASVAAAGVPRVIHIPAAPVAYLLNSKVQLNTSVPITFAGEGVGSLVKRGGTLGSKEGLFNVKQDNCTFYNFCVDGAVTSPTGLLYSDFSSDPMNSLLTTNTSFWLHGPVKNTTFYKMTIQHTGGYSILSDASSATGVYDSGSYDVWNTKIIACDFNNNRPHLFGTSSGDKNYGSWTGGIFLNTYGIQSGSNYLSTTYGTLVQGCFFRGNYGNCVWSHLYGFDQLHSDFRVIDNTFIDNGLDCVNIGGVSGFAVIGNRARRTGYIPATNSADVSIANPGVPKWLTNLNATAIDTSGLAKNGIYANNSVMSTNGGDIDADGLADSIICGNSLITPRSTDPEYALDKISVSGPAANGVTWSYGINLNNSSNTQFGSQNVNVVDNQIVNKNGGAIKMGASRYSRSSGNNINHPSDANVAPVQLYNIGTGSYQRAYGNVVTDNQIAYSPGSPVAAVQEISTYGAFSGTDKNYVYDNILIGSNVYEFYKDTNSSSTTGWTLSLTQSLLGSKSNTYIGRYRNTVTGQNYDYTLFQYDAGTIGQSAFLSDHSVIGVGGYCTTSGTSVTWVSGDNFSTLAGGDTIVINGTNYTVSTPGSTSLTLSSSAGTQTAVVFTTAKYRQGESMLNVATTSYGSVTTGTRTILGFDDVVATGKVSYDGFLIGTDATYAAQQANKLSDTYGLIRYDSTVKAFKFSTSATAGVRNWTTLSGVSPGGSSQSVQYNTGPGTFAGDGNLLWDNSAQLLTVTGKTGTAGVFVGTSYVQADQGFYTTSAASTAIQAPSGGVTALSLISIRNDGSSGLTVSRTSATARNWGLAVNSSGSLLLNDDSAPASRMTVDTSGLFTIGSTIQLDQSGNISQTGTLHLTGTGGGINVSGASGASVNYNAIQVSGGGGMYARSFTALKYIQAGTSSGAPTVTASDSFNAGALYWDTGVPGLQVYNGSSWVSVATGVATNYWSRSGTTITQATAGDNLNLSASGVFQIAGTTVIDASRNITNAVAITASSTIQSTITGASVAFQAGGGNFQAYGNGNVNGLNFNCGASGSYQVNGTTVIDSSRNITNAVAVTASGTIKSTASGSSIAFQVGTGNVQIDGNGNVSAAAVITSTGASGGINVTGQTAVNSIQTVGGVNVGSTGGANGVFQVDGTTVINSSGQFVGAGINVGANGISGGGYNVNGGYIGQTWTINLPSPFTINGGVTHYSNLIFTGGVLTGAS